jgi:KDO2-lipid IV(A) lauroyltransferase
VLVVPLGWLMLRLMKRRRIIAQRNIERCFPDESPAQHQKLLEKNFRSLALMVFEVTWSWSAPVRRLRKMGRVEGLENARAAMAKGKGVLAITHHVTCLEIGGRLAAIEIPDAMGVYRPIKNPVLEWYQNRSRAKYTRGGISKRDMRAAIRFLRGGGILWYAPDQDFGAKRSVFVPFFGIETATLEATGRLIELTGCEVMPMFPVYDATSRQYIVRMYPALDDFPSGDITHDLARLNAMMEKHVREAPEQYWWIHRRFKTRPEGEPPFYD